MKKFNQLLLCLSAASLIISCKERKHLFEIVKTPVFSETDSFLSSTNYLQHNKHDYYLVRTNIADKKEIIRHIDSFVNQNASKQYSRFDNYIMFFYRESENLNESILKEDTSQSKYKIFFYNEDDRIVVYSYYESKLSRDED